MSNVKVWPTTSPTRAQHRPKNDPLFVEHDIEPKIAHKTLSIKVFFWRFFHPDNSIHGNHGNWWKSWNPTGPNSQSDSVKQKFSQSMSKFTFFSKNVYETHRKSQKARGSTGFLAHLVANEQTRVRASIQNWFGTKTCLEWTYYTRAYTHLLWSGDTRLEAMAEVHIHVVPHHLATPQLPPKRIRQRHRHRSCRHSTTCLWQHPRPGIGLRCHVKTRHSPFVLDLEPLRSIASSVHMLTCEVLQFMLLFDR